MRKEYNNATQNFRQTMRICLKRWPGSARGLQVGALMMGLVLTWGCQSRDSHLGNRAHHLQQEGGHAAIAPQELQLVTQGVPIFLAGNIESYLESITYGSINDNAWPEPMGGELTTLTLALNQLMADDIDSAADLADDIGFQVISYADNQYGEFYILRDTPTNANMSPGGTYVWNPQAQLPAVIEVPHPRFESYTRNQGIELFLTSEATLLLLSGTHRRSDPNLSSCDFANSNDYRRSDPAHAVQHWFHAVHVAAEDSLDAPLFIQLHGVGGSGYLALKTQCGHNPPNPDPMLLVNISDTFKANNNMGAPPQDSFVRLLEDTINAEGTIKACLYNEDTSIYGGTLNTQARYTNQSPDPCNTYASDNNGRFVHLEQTYNTRRYQRDLINSLITDAMEAYFSQ